MVCGPRPSERSTLDGRVHFRASSSHTVVLLRDLPPYTRDPQPFVRSGSFSCPWRLECWQWSLRGDRSADSHVPECSKGGGSAARKKGGQSEAREGGGHGHQGTHSPQPDFLSWPTFLQKLQTWRITVPVRNQDSSASLPFSSGSPLGSSQMQPLPSSLSVVRLPSIPTPAHRPQ